MVKSHCAKTAEFVRSLEDALCEWLNNRSRMSGDVQVRIREHLRGRFPWVTRLVILCESQTEAEAALTEVRQWVDAKGLQLHPDKTHVGDSRQAGQGFDFLGYRFESGKRWVRQKNLMRIKDGIRAKTKRTRGESLSCVIADLNPMLRGWYGSFKHAHPSVFRRVDGFLRRRVRALLRKQEKRPGLGRCLADHQRWTNAFFAEVGLFALYPAWQTERHPR